MAPDIGPTGKIKTPCSNLVMALLSALERTRNSKHGRLVQHRAYPVSFSFVRGVTREPRTSERMLINADTTTPRCAKG